MRVLEVGDPWQPQDVGGRLDGVEWLHVGGLLRSDFPPETLAALAAGAVLSLDGQVLVRPGRTGPAPDRRRRRSGHPRAAQILTLSEEEAEVLGAPEVPEVVVTLGSRGSLLYAGGEEHRIEPEPVSGVDPTGAGDAFAVGYLAARSGGAEPLAAARRASASGHGAALAAMRALVETVDGLFEVDLELEEVIDFDPDGSLPRLEPLELPLPGVVAADASGSTMVAVVDRRPPARGLLRRRHDLARDRRRPPAGRAVAIAADDPDLVLFAARNRLYLSRTAAASGRASRRSCPRFARLGYGSLNSPRATIMADPPTATRSICSRRPVDTRVERRRPADLGALRDLDLVAERDPAVAREVQRERPCGRAGRRVLVNAGAGANIRVFHASPEPAKQLTPITAGRSASRPRSGRSAATSSSESSVTYTCRMPLS